MSAYPVRRINGVVVVLVPAGRDAYDLAALLQQVNAIRVRNREMPLPAAADLADALVNANAQAAIFSAVVPHAEQRFDADQVPAVDLITTDQAAAVLGITERGVRQRIARRKLAARRIGQSWYIDPADLQERNAS